MERDWLAERFEDNRAHLQMVAYRMLGSLSEADDAVQEAWLRLSRADADGIENLGGWLTTVVGRVCLDMLRSRQSRREEPLPASADRGVSGADGSNPEQEALLAESIGLALLVVLDNLTPAERVAFVLHDMFAVPFEDVAAILGRSPEAARQLASRARRRVQGAATAAEPDVSPQRQIVDAFLAASRAGDFGALLAVLDPEVALRADPAAIAMGAPAQLKGAQAVAEQFAGRAKAAQPALVDGTPGLVWAPGGRPRVVFQFTFAGGKVVRIEMLADRQHLDRLNLATLQ